MITIAEPKKHIADLLGKQQINSSEEYRIMKYVFRVDYRNRMLLYNVITGHLVILDQTETDVFKNSMSSYSPVMDMLIADRFLVPKGFDEHRQVVNLRTVLQKYKSTRKSKAIRHYTILPTTGCNARCYYCFEQGVKTVTMTEETANEVVRFISSNCGPDKQIAITWFGGEPTVASKRINQICKGLQDKGIEYHSQMISNGYLLDEEMIIQAKDLWNLKSIQISVDGTEDNYNRIKAFVGVKDNPYQRVMNNIGILLDNKIKVNLRMNFDIENYYDFENLVIEADRRYGGNEYLNVRAHPINGEYKNHNNELIHGSDEWFSHKIVELNSFAAEAGLFIKKGELPCFRYDGCMASDDSSVTITPEGFLVNCPEHIGEEYYIGNIKNGITNAGIVESWKELCDYQKCADCFLFPYCNRVKKCSAKDSCNYYLLYIQQFSNAVKEKMDMSFHSIKGGLNNEI